MSSRPAQRRASTRALHVSALLLALAGLFAMHGLGDHGATGTSHHSPSVMAGTTHVAASGMEYAAHAAQTGAALSVASLSPATGSDGPLDSSALGMCVAVLLLLTAVAVALAPHRGDRRLAVLSPGPRPPTRGRSPDPPDLIRLSIQRC